MNIFEFLYQELQSVLKEVNKFETFNIINVIDYSKKPFIAFNFDNAVNNSLDDENSIPFINEFNRNFNIMICKDSAVTSTDEQIKETGKLIQFAYMQIKKLINKETDLKDYVTGSTTARIIIKKAVINADYSLLPDTDNKDIRIVLQGYINYSIINK